MPLLSKHNRLVHKPLHYLASPYTHPDADTREVRYRLAVLAMATLQQRGQVVFSPIVHTHHMKLVLRKAKASLTSEQWCEYDLPMMECCDAVIVLRLPGWENSKGIKFERDWFREHGRPESFMDMEETDIRFSWPENIDCVG